MSSDLPRRRLSLCSDTRSQPSSITLSSQHVVDKHHTTLLQKQPLQYVLRSFWSSTSPTDESTNDATSTSTSDNGTALPLPPLTPSTLPLTTLLTYSTIEALRSLPEIQSVLDLLDGSSQDTTNPYTKNQSAEKVVKEAHSNLQRARDIFQSMPELHAATYLLEVALHAHVGEFKLALEGVIRYQHLLSKKKQQAQKFHLQLIKAKLLFHTGQFTHSLSEYEDLLEHMEEEVERQMKKQQQEKNKDDDRLPVINGAATLTGVGLNKLMLHVHSAGDDDFVNNATKQEVFEAIETATDMLVESRTDALLSVEHSGLALDLGLVASISLTNLGVVHCLMINDKKSTIKYWKRGLEILDTMLSDSMYSAVIIPNDKFQCMESVRARLYCNIASVLLQLDGSSDEAKGSKTIDEDALKEASEMSRKALEIYDELINGPKILRDGGITEESDETSDPNDDTANDDTANDESNSSEWDQLLKEKVKAKKEQGDTDDPAKPKETPLSPLWIDYNRSESARALGLVAQCYAHAGAAVTAEGLFQSAIDASSSYPLGQSMKVDGIVQKGVSMSSPNLGLVARDVRLWYAMLCDSWDKRKGDADRLRLDASKIEETGVLAGFVKEKDGLVSSLVSSLWLFSPLDLER